MRPTWHLVAAEDIRWMLKLSAQRVIAANASYAKGHGLEITDELYAKSYNLLEKILCRNKSLTKQEIAEHFCRSGILAEADNHRMTRLWHVRSRKVLSVAEWIKAESILMLFWKNGCRQCRKLQRMRRWRVWRAIDE